MWVDKQTMDDLRLSEANARGIAQALERQVIAQNTTLDWMRIRLTQLEHERAVLIQNYMGISITTPVFEKAPVKSTGVGQGRSEWDSPLNAVPSFEDIGDEEAARLGIEHNGDGTVRYK